MNASAMRSRRISTPVLDRVRAGDFRDVVGHGEDVVHARRERLLRVTEREEAVDADVGQAERRRLARRDREAEVARVEAARHVRLGIDAIDRDTRLVDRGRAEHDGVRYQGIDEAGAGDVARRREVRRAERVALLGVGRMHPCRQAIGAPNRVDADAELMPPIDDVRRLRVAVARLVRQRHVGVEQARRDPVEPRCRDHVAGKWLTGQRIADGRAAREVAGPLRRARHDARVGGAAAVAKAFVVAEHERLVRDDLPAGRAAELMLIEGRLGHREAIAGLERVVAIEPPAGAAPLVRAAAGDHADDGAGVAAVLGVEGVREDAELVDGVGRRAQHEAGVEAVVVGRAIEQEVVRLVAHAVDVEAAGDVAEAARGGVAGLSAERGRRREHTGHQRAELGEVAPVERQFDQVAGRDQQPERSLGRLDQRRLVAVDGRAFGDDAKLQRHLETRVRAGPDDDMGPGRGLEPRQLHPERVVAGTNTGEGEGAGAVRDGLAHGAGRVVRQLDVGARNVQRRRVDDVAADRAGGLGLDERGNQGERQAGDEAGWAPLREEHGGIATFRRDRPAPPCQLVRRSEPDRNSTVRLGGGDGLASARVGVGWAIHA